MALPPNPTFFLQGPIHPHISMLMMFVHASAGPPTCHHHFATGTVLLHSIPFYVPSTCQQNECNRTGKMDSVYSMASAGIS